MLWEIDDEEGRQAILGISRASSQAGIKDHIGSYNLASYFHADLDSRKEYLFGRE
jgi:hypothetical protein